MQQRGTRLEGKVAITTGAGSRDEWKKAVKRRGLWLKSADCQAMVPAAMERYGALHILLNNVGGSGVGSVVEVDEEYGVAHCRLT